MASLIKFGSTMELLLLSTGLISTFFMLKKTISPHYVFNMVLFYLSEILNSLKSFLSSPLYICLFINSVVILILTFSKFHLPIKKFLNVLLVEKDVDATDISSQPQVCHQEKDDYMPNRTNSAIAMDTVMSFFSPYNSHPPVFDEMPCSSVPTITTNLLQSQTSWDRLRAKANCVQTTTIPQSQTSWDQLRAKPNSAQTTTSLLQSQTSWDYWLRAKIHSEQTTTSTTTLSQSQTSWERVRAKTNCAQTTTTTILPQSQTSWDRVRPKANSPQTTTTTTTLPQRVRPKANSTQTSYNFPDMSHLTEARELVSRRSSNLPHETITRTNYQENIEEGELEDDSLEATWKAITKKKELKKSLTFNDTLSMSRIGGLRGDISVSTEESNKKFDDFIKKINHERLLQRKESDQRAHNVNMLNRAR